MSKSKTKGKSVCCECLSGRTLALLIAAGFLTAAKLREAARIARSFDPPKPRKKAGNHAK